MRSQFDESDSVVFIVTVVIVVIVGDDDVHVVIVCIIVLQFVFLLIFGVLEGNLRMKLFSDGGLSLLGGDHEEGELSGRECVLTFLIDLLSVEDSFVFAIPGFGQRIRLA